MNVTKNIKEAIEIRKYIENLASQLDDTQALENINSFPLWRPDIEVEENERYRYDSGELFKVIKPHTTNWSLTPTTSPEHFIKVVPEEE